MTRQGEHLQTALIWLLAVPSELERLAAGDTDSVRNRFDLDATGVSALQQLADGRLQRYLRDLQSKRLRSLGSAFPGSVQVAATILGWDSVASEFWSRYPQRSGDEPTQLRAKDTARWIAYLTSVSATRCPSWLTDLARYEQLRAVLVPYPITAEPRSDMPRKPNLKWLSTQMPKLAAGTIVSRFAHDVVELLPKLTAGLAADNTLPTPTRRLTALLSRRRADNTVEIFRIPPSTYSAIRRCDGTRPIGELLEEPGTDRDLAGILWGLLSVGVLHLPPCAN